MGYVNAGMYSPGRYVDVRELREVEVSSCLSVVFIGRVRAGDPFVCSLTGPAALPINRLEYINTNKLILLRKLPLPAHLLSSLGLNLLY